MVESRVESETPKMKKHEIHIHGQTFWGMFNSTTLHASVSSYSCQTNVEKFDNSENRNFCKWFIRKLKL